MEDRFCPSCGTEVEPGARFCPTCGSTLSTDMEDGPELPTAPLWPPPEQVPDGSGEPAPTEAISVEKPDAPHPEPDAEQDPAPEPDPVPEQEPAPEPDRTSEPLAPPPPQAPPPASSPGRAAWNPSDLPITWPTTLSGWLIGGGSLLAALSLIPRLGSVLSLLLFLALLGVAATVFLADRVPDVPRQRLAILVVAMIGLGVGLARAGFTVQGADTVFLVGMLAAAGGSLLIELDRDRPMPPPERTA